MREKYNEGQVESDRLVNGSAVTLGTAEMKGRKQT